MGVDACFECFSCVNNYFVGVSVDAGHKMRDSEPLKLFKCSELSLCVFV